MILMGLRSWGHRTLAEFFRRDHYPWAPLLRQRGRTTNKTQSNLSLIYLVYALAIDANHLGHLDLLVNLDPVVEVDFLQV